MTEEPDPVALIKSTLFEGWGVHTTRWVLLVLLVDRGDEGISWPDGLGPAMKAADPDLLLQKHIDTYDSPKMAEEFKNWLLAAHLVWGMPLLKEFR